MTGNSSRPVRLPRRHRSEIAAILVVAWLVLLSLTAGLRASGYLQLLSVESRSMAPVLHKGDAVLVERTDPSRLRPSDLISYRSRQYGGITVTHRLVWVDMETGRLAAKGDANTVPDPPAGLQDLVGKVRLSVPYLGRASGWLRGWPGLVAALYLPAGLLLGGELRRLLAAYARPVYCLPGRRVR